MEVTYDELCHIALTGRFKATGWRQKLEDFVVWTGSKSNYLAKKLVDLPLSAAAFSAPTPIFFGLWTSALDDTSTSATSGEAAYTSYARVSVTNNATNFPAASGTTTATKNNANAITFPASTGSTATVTFMGIFDVASGAGNMLYWCSVTSTTIANVGDTPQVAASGLTVVED